MEVIMNIKELFQLADELRDNIKKTESLNIDTWNQIKNKIISTNQDRVLEEETKAIDLMIQRSFSGTLLITEELLKQMHQELSENLNKESAGKYRDIQILQTGTKKIPDPKDLPHLMEHFIGQINTSKSFFHPIEFATYVYKRIFDIQPFINGNELVANLLLNCILLSEGYGVIFIQPQKDERFLRALELAQNYEHPVMDPIIEIIAEYVVKDEQEYNKCISD